MPIRRLLLLTILSAALFFTGLGATSVYQVAEARNAECAREMAARNDWVVPVFNGRLRTDKPALEYFAMIAAYRIGGVSEASARFFPALCGVLLILATFLFVRLYLGERAAWWSALVLLASPHLIFQFRLATPDPYLILLDTLALYAYFCGRDAYRKHGKGWGWYAAMYALLGLAVLGKGPVGLLLPGLAIGVMLLIKKELSWKEIGRLKPWWGLGIVAVCAAPWYVLVHLRTGGAWTRAFFLTHNVGRFDGAMGGHGGIFLVTLGFVALGMLPFSVFAVQSIRGSWKKAPDLAVFSLIVFCSVVVFYAASRTKLINYTVPAYPFLAILTGYFLDRLCVHPVTPPKGARASFLVLGILTTLMPVAAFLWTRSGTALRPFWWIALCMLLYPAGTWTGYVFFRRGKIARGLSWVVATFVCGTLILFAGPYPALDGQTPLRKIQAMVGSGKPVAAYRKFPDGLVFYVGRPVPVLTDTGAVRSFFERHPDGLLVTREKHADTLEALRGILPMRADPEIFSPRIVRVYRWAAPDTGNRPAAHQ